MSENNLEVLYAESRQALKAKDYERAADLLKQILVLDENYKDASRLLAQLVKEKRRRWYNDLRIWGPVFGIVIIGLLVWIAPKLPWQMMFALPTATVSPTGRPLPTLTTAQTFAPTLTTSPTATTIPTATPIPLTWKRISTGQEFPRDTVTAIVFDPKNADVIYVSTQNAGMYKSLDGGLSWQPIQRGLNRASIASLAIDPHNPDILFAGANFGGVYKTLDGGQNWFPINSTIDVTEGADNFSLVVNDPQDSRNLYYTNGSGFYRSTNGGENWTKLQAGLDIDYILVNPITPSELLRTEPVERGYAVFKSLDRGDTWKQTDMPYASHIGLFKLAANPVRPGQVFAYAPWIVYRSDDFGDHWEHLVSEGNTCVALAVDPVDGGRAYCASTTGVSPFSNPNVFQFQFSRDAGQMWQKLSDISQLYFPVQALAVSPLNNSRIILAGEDGLLASVDGGLSWKPIENGLGATRTNFLADFNPSGLLSLVLFTGDIFCPDCETQLFISRDQGNSWEFWQHGLTFSTAPGGFFWTSRTNFWTGGYLSTGPGNLPQKIRLPQDNLLLYPDAFVPNRLFAANACAGATGTLYLSQDGGITWKASTKIDQICNVQFSFVDSDPDLIYLTNAYSSETDSGLYRSEDGGLSWAACGSTKTSWYSKGRSGRLAIDPLSPQHVFLATNTEGVLVSTDGCRTWQASSAGLGSLYINAVVIDPDHPNTIYAGTDGGAYISTNGGGTWNQVNDGLLGATVVYSIMVDKDSNIYAATPYGVFKLESQ